jgi:hypothetical protein
LPNKAKHRKKGRGYFTKYFVIIIAFTAIIGSSIYFAFFQQSYVTPQQFENYARSLIPDYGQSLNSFFPETWSDFDLARCLVPLMVKNG